MDQILNQLGELVLGSVPTMILFILLVAAYGLMVRRPLDEVLAERRARTTGAVEQAKGALAAAEAETSVYEDRLRAAKAEIFHLRDQRHKQLAAERDSALDEVRKAAQMHIQLAKREVDETSSTARQQIEAMSSQLSAQILRAVLPNEQVSQEITR